MKLAIAGSTCTGKTSTSKLVGDRTGAVVRHCGEELKRVVRERASGLSIPLEVHKSVDCATKDWVNKTDQSLIVEGRYLFYVLSQTKGILLVQLECELEERIRRASQHRQVDPRDFILNSDIEDVHLTKVLYQDVVQRCADIVINTSNLSSIVVAERICTWLESV